MAEWLQIDEESEPNVEEIMRQIREHVAHYREEDVLGEIEDRLATKLGGGLGPRVYQALATALRQELASGVVLQVRRSSLPLVGRLIDAVRGELHRLALFYVNRHASSHAVVETELLRTLALTLLAMEKVKSELAEMRTELANLRQGIK